MARLRLQLGYRPGWPGTQLANYVTHAVYRINAGGGVGNRGVVKGYGKPAGGGVIILDRDAVQNAQYHWYEPTLFLNQPYIDVFEDTVAAEAANITYTGIGANCYTPLVRGVEAILAELRRKHASRDNIADAQRLLNALLGSNYGMGTQITNKLILAGLALVTGFCYVKAYGFPWGNDQNA